MPRLAQLKSVSAATLLVAAACSGLGLDEKATDPANGTGQVKNWAFTISISKNNFTVQQGAIDTLIATITRTGGFSGAVTLQTFAPPGPGLTLSVENITTTGVVTTARVILAVSNSFPPGSETGFGLSAMPVSNEVMGTSVNVTFTVVAKPGVFVNVAPTLSVGRGQSGGTRVSMVRTAFTTPVPMTLVTTVAGITATFAPNPVIDTVTQMTVNVASTVTEGSYSLGVRANEGVTGQATAPLTLTVTAPGSIALTFPLNLLIVRLGNSTPIGLTIARSNYAGPVTFTVAGVPAGVTAMFGNPAPGNVLSITFSATASAVLGSYPITFTGSGSGLTAVSATLTLQVAP